MLLTALCLNPCVDRTVQVAQFSVGGTNRILAEHSDGAGKGVNVAVVAQRLGIDAACVGLLSQENGRSILDRLQRDGVQAVFVRTPGALRVNLKIRDESSQTITELNEPGSEVPPDLLAEARGSVLNLAAQSDYMVLTGSLPPGCPEDFYSTLMAEMPKTCRCVADVSGDRMQEVLRGNPYLIKPNQQELEQACGKKLDTLRDVRDAAFAMIRKGAQLVAVSMGSEGALLTDGRLTLFAPALTVPVRSTVCAGDSMIAGIIKGLREDGGLKHALHCGVAAATATVADEIDGLMHPEAYEKYFRAVKVSAV